MGVVTRAKKRMLEEVDHISSLPDAVLGNIVSFLPTKEGARTQVLSSKWHHIWRYAPLNIDLTSDPTITRGEVSRVLSSHRGSVGRRFSIPPVPKSNMKRMVFAADMDAWLRSPSLNNLEELEFHLSDGYWQFSPPTPPLPASARRFSSTLRVASFGGCGFSDEDAHELHLPHLKQLTLCNVTISESSLDSLVANCPVLESLLLHDTNCCPRFHVRSPSLRSLGVSSGCRDTLRHLIIEDAPCLERLLPFIRLGGIGTQLSVIYAPRLDVLGPLYGHFPRLRFGNTNFQVPSDPSSLLLSPSSTTSFFFLIILCDLTHQIPPAVSMDLVCRVKVLALSMDPSLDEAGRADVWCHYRDRNLVGGLDIRLKKVVFTNYRGKMSHVKITKFFVLNARLLESMRLELEDGNVSKEWIEKQHKLLKIEKRASMGARFDFVPRNIFNGSLSLLYAKQVHDLSITDPFHMLHV
ncbi:unnamed protein product [Urochloa decumbens]|uniref:F-box domain-containing protein n=1 Tax=Urochloa decumbens TaxID=240449 RepID=A0ABC9FN67_9POAL